jgi:hypothetical protein
VRVKRRIERNKERGALNIKDVVEDRMKFTVSKKHFIISKD